jgi:tetratricopeptide (TPR) repeat protein
MKIATKVKEALKILEYLVGLAVFVSLFLFIYINMSFELKDPDIWLHLKTGEYIFEHKAVPHIDIFSATARGKPWLDHSWLVQLIFYLVFHFGGPDNLILLSAMTVSMTFLILFFSVYRRNRDLAISVALLFLAALASRLRFNIRPENFSILFYAIYLFVLSGHLNSRLPLLLPLVQIFWVNSHGFFILGPLTLGVFILAEKMKKSMTLPWEWNRIGVMNRHAYKQLVQVFYLSILACFINPYGYRTVLYPLWVTFASLGKSSIFYNYIRELLPTWRYYDLLSSYYLLILLSLAVFALNFRKINLGFFMLWLLALVGSLRVNRNTIFFNLIAFVATASILAKGIRPQRHRETLFRRLQKILTPLKIIALGMLMFWVWKENFSMLNSQYYIFEEHRVKSSLLGIAPKNFPEKAADFLIKNKLPGNIFNLFNYGSYLIWRLYPERRVFIDGRTELYGEEYFKDYQRILALDKDTIKRIFDRYNINTVFLYEERRELAQYFFDSPDWVLVYLDGDSLLFIKNAPENKDLVERLRLDLAKWETKKVDLKEVGLKKVYPDIYIKRAWALFYLGFYEQALGEVRQALRVRPDYAQAYNIIGRIELKQKLYDQAFEDLRLAHIYAPSNLETMSSLGEFYTLKENYDDALKVYKKMTAVYPVYAEGYQLLAKTYLKKGNKTQAIKLLRKAVRLDPFQAALYKDLGAALCENNAPLEAVKVYRDALAMKLDSEYFRNAIASLKQKILK